VVIRRARISGIREVRISGTHSPRLIYNPTIKDKPRTPMLGIIPVEKKYGKANQGSS
jgi:hypothetical protein